MIILTEVNKNSEYYDYREVLENKVLENCNLTKWRNNSPVNGYYHGHAYINGEYYYFYAIKIAMVFV